MALNLSCSGRLSDIAVVFSAHVITSCFDDLEKLQCRPSGDILEASSDDNSPTNLFGFHHSTLSILRGYLTFRTMKSIVQNSNCHRRSPLAAGFVLL